MPVISSGDTLMLIQNRDIILIVMSDRNHWIGEKEVVSCWHNSREHDKVSAYSYLILTGIPWHLTSIFGWDKDGKIQSLRKHDRNKAGEGQSVLYVPNLSPFHSCFRSYFGISTYFSNWELPIYCMNSKSTYCLEAESMPASWALESCQGRKDNEQNFKWETQCSVKVVHILKQLWWVGKV